MTVLAPQHWSAARAWHTNAVLVAIGSGLLLLTRQLISESDHFTIGNSGVSGWSVILFAAAVWLILTQPVDRFTFPIILTVATACRLVVVFPEPFLSSDVYRYAWDGVVQHAHISPYRYVPGDKALTFLREPNQDLFDSMNRRDYAHTIYPPAAQFIFYLITFINPSVTAMKTGMILFEGLTMYGLATFLRELGVRREQSLLYAWCPLLIWEIGEAGHLDSAAMAFIVLTLLARYRKQAVWTGVFLAVAILIKLYPVVLLPALFRRGEYKMPAVVAAIVAFGYACYSSVGVQVFGFLNGYVKEEGMQTGARYFLLELTQHVPGLHTLPTVAFLAFCAAVFLAIFIWAWRTCCRTDIADGDHLGYQFGLPAEAEFLVPAISLALALMLLFSPHYPWYVAWLIPFLVLIPSLTVFTYSCGLFYLCYTALATGYGAPQFQLNEILYGSVLIAFVVEVALRRWPLYKHVFPAVIAEPHRLAPLEVQRQS
ncbi:glycosyltransferase family 87 protein [Granulicella arctica]|uniref:glycosyltransferase family 87 protein n=1 Tax=Granulicella arctica TaxID=940613 RepID=UPI0021E00679|nr:glycosyltransferase family 87 protein [Granulicella arctica]